MGHVVLLEVRLVVVCLGVDAFVAPLLLAERERSVLGGLGEVIASLRVASSFVWRD